MGPLLAVTGLLLVCGVFCLSQRWHKEAVLIAVPLVICIMLLLPRIAAGPQ